MPESGGPYDVAEPTKENDPKDGKYAGREHSAESPESSGDVISWLLQVVPRVKFFIAYYPFVK